MNWNGWVWPVAITDRRYPVITQGYKPPRHLGVDIMFPKRAGDPLGPVKHDASLAYVAPAGTLILAAGPGRVWSSGEGQYGKYVLIDHGNVPGIGGVTTFYQHLASLERNWQKGDVVFPGQVLGTMGYSPGLDSEQLRHLHFELRFPGSPASQADIRWAVNPAPYMALWRMTTAPSNDLGTWLLLGAAAALLYALA